jgi:hypothetical protein
MTLCAHEWLRTGELVGLDALAEAVLRHGVDDLGAVLLREGGSGRASALL